MNNEYLTEKIGAIKNETSHIWGSIFITGGGAVTFAITDLNSFNLLLVISGILLSMLFINAYFIRKQELINILNMIKEG